MSKKNNLLLLGVTANLTFAAGVLLISLRRHSPALCENILLYHDGKLSESDAALLQRLGAELRWYDAGVLETGKSKQAADQTGADNERLPAGGATGLAGSKPATAIRQDIFERFTPLAFSRLEALRLLAEYRKIIWLDVDTAVQGDLSPLLEYGPLSMAREDPYFSPDGKPARAGVNINVPVNGFDPEARNLNTGVIVFDETLPEPEKLYELCFKWLKTFAGHINFADQFPLNMLAQYLEKRQPGLFRLLPHERFNAHPRNPEVQTAALVHGFGPYKPWSDGRILALFPEWLRDYRRWLELGGSPWPGEPKHAEYYRKGPFYLLGQLPEKLSQ